MPSRHAADIRQVAQKTGRSLDEWCELLEANGRDPASVKRSFMGPFANFQGNEGADRLDAYIEAGCQRFMLQFYDYDNLEPIERWAQDYLPRFHAPA